MSIHPAAAEGFDRGVADYERGRPGYPPAAVARLVEALRLGPGVAVCDLAAGTGKLTRELVACGAEVIAVEPVRAMRAALARLPGVRVLEGTAESLPLGDAAVGAVTVAQAFHWFDGERALAEIHRVLGPRGRLALIWNRRDERQALQRRITEIVEPYRGDAPRHSSLAWKSAFEGTTLFTPLAELRFPWVQDVDAEGLAARVTSISFIAALPEPERTQVARRVRELVPASGALPFAYDTHLYWCERR